MRSPRHQQPCLISLRANSPLLVPCQQHGQTPKQTRQAKKQTPTGCRAKNISMQKRKIDYFKIKIVTFIANFGRNNIIRNGQIHVPKRGPSTRGINPATLEPQRTYLTHHTIKINSIYVQNTIQK